METDTKTIKALMYFWLPKIKVKKSWKSFQNQNKRRQSRLQNWVFTVCDAILSPSLMSKQTGHFAKKHLQITKALNAVSRIKVQNQKWMTRENASPANLKGTNIEAKRNFIPHWLACWDCGSQNTFQTMIGDVIDTFRKTTPAVKKKFSRKKSKLSQILV